MSSLFFLSSSFLKLLAQAFFNSLDQMCYWMLGNGNHTYCMLGSVLHDAVVSIVEFASLPSLSGLSSFPSHSLLDSVVILGALACRFPSWSPAYC